MLEVRTVDAVKILLLSALIFDSFVSNHGHSSGWSVCVEQHIVLATLSSQRSYGGIVCIGYPGQHSKYSRGDAFDKEGGRV
jgi:hypothetical protein